MATKLSPTLIAPPTCNAEEDAKKLRAAMKGLGTDEDTLIDILTHRTCDQRLEIKDKYFSMFGMSLESSVQSETSGNFLVVLEALLMDRTTLSAHTMYKAMKGAGTDEKTLIHVLCPLTNEEIMDIKDAYREVLDKNGVADASRTLETDLDSDLGGYFKRIMLALVQANREESFRHDTAKYNADMVDIYEAGEGRLGTDEETFIRIFACRSAFHLRHLSMLFQQQTGKTLLEAIKSEISGDLCRALSLILSMCEDSTGSYAEMLNSSIQGLGTDDPTLIYIIVSRSEIDLKRIAQVYQEKYEVSLVDAISGDTSGYYKMALLALLGEK